MESMKFKQTDVGVIPEDWEVKSLNDLCVKIQDGTHFSPKINGGNYLYITSKNIRFGYMDISNADRIDKTQHEAIYKRCDVKFGDLLLTKDGANTGNAAISIIKEEYSLLSSVAFLRFDTSKYDPAYFLQQILSHAGQYRIKEAMSGNAITRLTLEKIKKLSYPLPATIKEQTAIATALSDMDELINGLEKIIAKKQNIKQGVTQNLFTPRKNWSAKKLSELGKVYGGLSGKSKDDFENGTFPYIPFMNIMNNPIIDLHNLGLVNIKKGEYQNRALKDDLFFNGSSETPEEVGMCSVITQDYPDLFLNSFCFGFRLNKGSDAHGLFLAYFFRSPRGRSIFFAMAQGATRYNLSKANFNKLEIYLPSRSEQLAISETLSDLDTEIKALESKLSKYRQIKIGMMQTLLTGKIRLV